MGGHIRCPPIGYDPNGRFISLGKKQTSTEDGVIGSVLFSRSTLSQTLKWPLWWFREAAASFKRLLCYELFSQFR